MTKCAIKQCKSYSGKTNNVSFHLFPQDPERKRVWVAACRRDSSWIPTKHTQICSLHFTTDSFNIRCKKQRKLHNDAIPTLCLPVYEKESHEPGHNYVIQMYMRTKRLLKGKIEKQRKQIKRLQYHNRCLKKKVTRLEKTLDSLNEKSLVSEDTRVRLENISGKTLDLSKRIVPKIEPSEISVIITRES